MNYIMGSTGRSFVTDWGTNPPKRPHHRGASCASANATTCDFGYWNNPDLTFPNVLPGALVGGPNFFDEFKDNHLDYVKSEVAVDYNAALIAGAHPHACSCVPLVAILCGWTLPSRCWTQPLISTEHTAHSID
jgi:hypothetical protein